MVIEGDFVPGSITSKWKAVKDYNVFTFPSINGSPPSVVASGDHGDVQGQPSRAGAHQLHGHGEAGSVM